MSGLRARYPGYEYENYQDFCDRTPEPIPDQVWIPDPPYPYLENPVGTVMETKPDKNDKTVLDENKLKTTISKRKHSKSDAQDNEKKLPPKVQQQKPVRKYARKVKDEELCDEKKSKTERQPTKRVYRKKKIAENVVAEMKPPKEKIVNKNKPKPRVKKPKDMRESGEIIIMKKVPTLTLTRVKLTKKETTSQSL